MVQYQVIKREVKPFRDASSLPSDLLYTRPFIGSPGDPGKDLRFINGTIIPKVTRHPFCSHSVLPSCLQYPNLLFSTVVLVLSPLFCIMHLDMELTYLLLEFCVRSRMFRCKVRVQPVWDSNIIDEFPKGVSHVLIRHDGVHCHECAIRESLCTFVSS